MRAVAYVTVNRANDPRFPQTIRGVVTQRYKGICQFSWFCDRNADQPRPGPAWETSQRIALEVLTGRCQNNPVGKSLFFHGKSVRPSWSRTKRLITRIGAHLFYR